MKYEAIYNSLKRSYTDKEIADSMVIPADLTIGESDKLANEMKTIRLQKLRESSERDLILADVMRLRFQIENYLKNETFSFEKTFGKFLSEYMRIVKKSRKNIAEDLAVHYTKFSRLINDKEEPNIELSYRLEKHSGELIKAELWYKLMTKKYEFIISQENEIKLLEKNKVSNPIMA